MRLIFVSTPSLSVGENGKFPEDWWGNILRDRGQEGNLGFYDYYFSEGGNKYDLVPKELVNRLIDNGEKVVEEKPVEEKEPGRTFKGLPETENFMKLFSVEELVKLKAAGYSVGEVKQLQDVTI